MSLKFKLNGINYLITETFIFCNFRIECIRSIEFGCMFEVHFENELCGISSVRLLNIDGSIVQVDEKKTDVSVASQNDTEPCYTLQITNKSLLVRIDNLKEGTLPAVYITTNDSTVYYAKDIAVYGQFYFNKV